jgi:hypothetical protein
MKARESAHLAELRWAELRLLQDHYREFLPFLVDVMELLGFGVTDIQADIAGFMAYGPQWLMVQAQRSQAKTTIAAAYCVWCLIHSPAHRILVVSAGGTQASEISTLIVRLVMNMPELECMRPDQSAGDKASVEHFDVHHSLKGTDKSPSVACVGITANLQGKRADLLLADDVESAKNSQTAHMREQLDQFTRDFASIVQTGRVLWLGTPQSNESIYNSLPARGVTVRIWPGRYPTDKQMENYGERLAPLLRNRLLADPTLATGGGLLGNQGKPTDPELLGEELLQQKELNQGEAYFQLQHMLNTRLTDALRYPLKVEKLVLLAVGATMAPLSVVRSMVGAAFDKIVGTFSYKLAQTHSVSDSVKQYDLLWAAVDPAAGGLNGDETAFAIGGFLNGNVYLLSVGAVPGGYDDTKMETLADYLLRYNISGVTIEKNLGYGAFSHIFTPVLTRRAAAMGRPCPAIEDDLVTGMKEARIIETLGPVIGRGSLIVTPDAVEDDLACCKMHPQNPHFYSFFYQLAKMQRLRNAVPHDDRVDAVEALVRRFQKLLAVNQEDQTRAVKEAALKEAIHRAMPKVFAKALRSVSLNSNYFKR